MRILLRKKTIRLLSITALCFAASIWTSPVSGRDNLIQAKVHRLIVDPGSQQPIVILADSVGERGLFIWISHFEANAIHSEMNGIDHFRPLTHDLMERVIKRANLRVERVVVTHIQEGVYYATISIREGSSLMEIDARPSDSIVMALKFNAPIFVSESLFREASVPLAGKESVEEGYGLRLQDLTSLLARAFSFDSTNGVLVSDVRKSSRAERDGIERGDIIVEVGGKAIDGVTSMREALQKNKVPVEARIFRKANVISVTIHPN